MNNLPEPANNEREILTAAGQKIYSAAIRTGVIGGMVSFLFALLAIATFFARHSDSPRFVFLSLVFLQLRFYNFELHSDPYQSGRSYKLHGSDEPKQGCEGTVDQGNCQKRLHNPRHGFGIADRVQTTGKEGPGRINCIKEDFAE
jgi:hypothetical protein